MRERVIAIGLKAPSKPVVCFALCVCSTVRKHWWWSRAGLFCRWCDRTCRGSPARLLAADMLVGI